MNENLQRIRSFRSTFLEFEKVLPALLETQPVLLAKLYVDCQAFAEREIGMLLKQFNSGSNV